MVLARKKFSLEPWETALLMHCQRRRYSPKAAILRQGEPADELFYIVKGSVTVLLEDESGQEIVLAYLYAREIFGELGMFTAESNRCALVRARADCEVAHMSYDRLRSMPDLYPRVLETMTIQLANRLRRTNRRLGDLAFMDVYGRVARTLLELSEKPDAMTHPDGMQVRVTRQELARLVACSREMVGKVLKEMEDHRQVQVFGRNIVVPNRPRLVPQPH
jgi:CRP/FNR family cyclic AMP-dependent transcriptional regulator